MLSFDSSDWHESVVKALIQIHNYVFDSGVVEQEDKDIVLEYAKGAVIVTTDLERCDLFNQKFQENLEPLPIIKQRVPIWFQGQDGINIDDRLILGLYLVDKEGVEHWAGIQSRVHCFDDKRWTDRIVSAQLLGLIVRCLIEEAGTDESDHHSKIPDVLGIEYNYLTYPRPDEILSYIKAVVLKP